MNKTNNFSGHNPTRDRFVLSLADELDAKCPPLSGIIKEYQLEPVVTPIVLSFLVRHGISPDSMVKHGHDKESKSRWTESKIKQNVSVFGCANSSDIFVTHPDGWSIYIELKLAKPKGKNSDSANDLPEAIQRSVGQSLIASMKHPYVICFIACKGKPRISKEGDFGKKFQDELWDKHHIALRVC